MTEQNDTGLSAEQVTQIWANPHQRSLVIHELARSLSKIGSFGLSPWLFYLSRANILSREEIVDLYLSVRKETGRLELEWRDEFITAFPQAGSALPATKAEGARYYLEERLYNEIVTRSDTRSIAETLRQLLSHGVSTASLTRIDKASIEAGGPLWNNDPTDPDSISFHQLAEMVQNREAAKLLTDVGGTLVIGEIPRAELRSVATGLCRSERSEVTVTL